VSQSLDVRSALARSCLLDELPAEALDPVVPLVRVRRLVRDQSLFRSGGPAYDAATYERLAAVKARWDPENLFRHSHNVVPS
jgi:hypothetical protein